MRNRLLKLPSRIYSVLLLFVFLTSVSALQAQIFPDYSVVEGVDPEVLVRQILVGNGIETSNITYKGAIAARGSFSGKSNLGINSGIILASGAAGNSKGPNNSPSKGSKMNMAGDADLSTLCGQNTKDASVLEFDFIPQSNVVEFRYVFGSEEYPEYVNSINDVFGFFISGPNISGPYSSPAGFPNGAKNIAIVPNTLPSAPVSINNINNGSNNNGPCKNCQYYVNNGTGTTPTANPYIQYDGFTTVLTARADVVPCETYHIKLAIADASDDILDSGVFLEANSFSSIGLAANVAYTHAVVDTAVEGCNSAYIDFKLFQKALTDYRIDILISGTAENGVDYDLIPDFIIIPQGDTMTRLTINPISDSIPENEIETVEIAFNSSICGELMDTVTIYIKDYPDYSTSVSAGMQVSCRDSIQLWAAAYGGIEPYSFQWSTGDSTSIIMLEAENSTQYTVRIGDICGSFEDQSVDVSVVGPVANAGEDVPICLNDDVTLTASGGSSWLWNPGGYTTQSITVSPPQTTTYTLTVYDECGNTDTDEVTVLVDQPFADAGDDKNICVDEQVVLQANDTPNGSWLWTDMLTGETYNGRIVTVTPQTSRQYCVDVTDNCGNTLRDCLQVDVFQLSVDAGENLSICLGETAQLSGSSSTGNGIFTWSDGTNTYSGANVEVSPRSTTTYLLTVDDGCIKTDEVTVTVNPLPLIDASAAVNSICPDESITLSANGGITYSWSASPPDPSLDGQQSNPSPQVTPIQNTTYTLWGTDANNCSNTDDLTITLKERMHADFRVAQPAVCQNDELLISYTANGPANATYNWDFDGGTSPATGQGPHLVSWSSAGTRQISLVVTYLGCSSEMYVQSVEVNPMPLPGFTVSETAGCEPLGVQFTNTSTNTVDGTIYTWDFGANGSAEGSSVMRDFASDGTYDISLIVTNPGNCTQVMTRPSLINVWPLPDASFSANPESSSMKNPLIGFSANSTGNGLTYLWNTGDGNSYTVPEFVHTYADSGNYQVNLQVTSEKGCVYETERMVYISPRYMLHIPTAFSPDGDGINDVFLVRGNGIKEYSIRVYNQWGEVVFVSTDINKSWDGTSKGVKNQPGLYVYHVYFRDENDEVSETLGSVFIVR
ncbi:hypothetical protein MASR1M74_24740 [Lentimicrobium sp.]